jgi:hypothetical protein
MTIILQVEDSHRQRSSSDDGAIILIAKWRQRGRLDQIPYRGLPVSPDQAV